VAANPVPVPDDPPRVRAALWFAEHGFGVFPCWSAVGGVCRCPKGRDCSSPGKHPLSEHGFKDATTEPRHIRTFLSAASNPNYGLLPPEGVFVLDVDGDDWEAQLASLEARYGALPPTLRTSTRNGQHIFLRWPASIPRPLKKIFGWVTRWGTNGYVIGPRSVHVSGFEYAPVGTVDIAVLPEAWAQAALAGTPQPGTITIGGGVDPESVQVGNRHDYLRDRARFFSGSIRDPDALFAAVWALNEKLPQPKNREEVERAIGDALIKYPADPTEQDPETGEERPQRNGGGVMLDVSEEERFPPPPHEAAFGGLVGEMVAELAAGTDAPRIGLLGSVLAFLGALAPCRGHFGRSQASSLFVGLVGPSGEGRKGTAMSRVHDLVATTLGYDVVSRSLLDGINSGEGLVTGLEFRQRSWKREPACVILFEEEFATLLAAQNRDGSSLDSRLRALWDITALSNRKQSGSQSVVPPYWASALVAITPDELRAKSPENATTTGSYNRWLWLPVIRRDEEVEDTPPALPRALAEALLEAHRRTFDDPPYLAMDPDAARMLSRYGRHLSAHTTGLELDLSRRLAPIAYRIGMIHAAIEGTPGVTVEQLARGIAVTEYARSGLRWVFGFTVGDRYAALLLRYLREQGVMTRNEITQSVVRDQLKGQAAIDEVVRLGFAERVKVATSGRPRYELRLVTSRPLFTPFVHSMHSDPPRVEGLHGMHESHKTHETHGMHETHETHERVATVTWLRPCQDYDNHRDNHRRTPVGWVCTACDEEAA
jgi:hypothetical protein